MVIDTREKIPSCYFSKTHRVYTIVGSRCALNHVSYVSEAPRRRYPAKTKRYRFKMEMSPWEIHHCNVFEVFLSLLRLSVINRQLQLHFSVANFPALCFNDSSHSPQHEHATEELKNHAQKKKKKCWLRRTQLPTHSLLPEQIACIRCSVSAHDATFSLRFLTNVVFFSSFSYYLSNISTMALQSWCLV